MTTQTLRGEWDISGTEMAELHLITTMGDCPERQNRFPNLLCLNCVYITRTRITYSEVLRGCKRLTLSWWRARKRKAGSHELV